MDICVQPFGLIEGKDRTIFIIFKIVFGFTIHEYALLRDVYLAACDFIRVG